VHELNALARAAPASPIVSRPLELAGLAVWTAMLLLVPGAGARSSAADEHWELQGYLGLLPMALVLAAPLKTRRNWLLLAIARSASGSPSRAAWLDLHRLAVRWAPGYGGSASDARADC